MLLDGRIVEACVEILIREEERRALESARDSVY
jgi:hypothetical protein